MGFETSDLEEPQMNNTHYFEMCFV